MSGRMLPVLTGITFLCYVSSAMADRADDDADLLPGFLGFCRYNITPPTGGSWHIVMEGAPEWGEFSVRGRLLLWLSRNGRDGPYSNEEIDFDSPGSGPYV